jgi:hypothetical protein
MLAPPSRAALKKRRQRKRRKDGLWEYRIDLPECEVAEALPVYPTNSRISKLRRYFPWLQLFSLDSCVLFG